MKKKYTTIAMAAMNDAASYERHAKAGGYPLNDEEYDRIFRFAVANSVMDQCIAAGQSEDEAGEAWALAIDSLNL